MTLWWKVAGALLALTGSQPAIMVEDGPATQVDQLTSPFTTFYPMPTIDRVPGILVLGGAEGGDAWARAVAERLAEHGYAAVAQAYFNGPGLAPQLQEIPLERLQQGIDRLVADPRVDRRHIAVLGFSKGAEGALLLASIDPRIAAVIAGSPSDLVWQGIDRQSKSVKSSWTMNGEALPFIPFSTCENCRSLSALYVRSRDLATTRASAAILVERARGPILLLASEADRVWPSETMAKSLQTRLKRHRFRHRVTLLRYPEGGHFTLGPLDPKSAGSDADFGGGTADGVVAARRDSWRRVIAFLDKTFGGKAAAR